MASITPSTTEANVFEDLSGNPSSHSNNPYNSLIEGCQKDPKQIQSRYETHRTARNSQQKAKLLSPNFTGFNIDQVLHKLVNKTQYPEYEDERNCLVFWARPPQHLKALIRTIQQRLLDVAPNLWLMPPDNLHMTTLEIAHSLTPEEIEKLVFTLTPDLPRITDHTHTHRARLLAPKLSYDTSALALSFLPGTGEEPPCTRSSGADNCTYHHLRRDIYSLCVNAGVTLGSRYTVPSAHLTIARFISQEDITMKEAHRTQADSTKDSGQGGVDRGKVKNLVEKIEEINAWLEKEYWPREGEEIRAGGEWIVGEEKGLDCRRGTLWYGGGETVRLGKGF